MIPAMRFAGRVVVVVTGSSRNIGLTTARRFAQEGARVVLNASTSADELEAARASLQSEGHDMRAVLADAEPAGSYRPREKRSAGSTSW